MIPAKRPEPFYVGVSGITTRAQVEKLRVGVSSGSPRKLMFGIHVSNQTLRGYKSSYKPQYVTGSEIVSLLSNDSDLLNLVHFDTETPWNLGNDLMKIIEITSQHLHGFELKSSYAAFWPYKEQLERFRLDSARLRKFRLVLEIGEDAVARVGHSPAKLLERLRDYIDLIDDVDLTFGADQQGNFDGSKLLEYVRAIAERYPLLGVSVSGGLGFRDFQTGIVPPLLRTFPFLNINAVEKVWDVRTSSLHVLKAERYVKKAFELLNRGQLWK